ncbi:hypothetical protein [Arthrobacter sp. ISL-28]|uniref:hypothetical protein n=1 Tax=Arthrobacter sp. ISL-28 TaxID=2819108 RepID=UPI001BEA4DA8|nr:hypothetical protein [Arthrobacter sp. ISL-28]MBT2523040.1 hypothetical protein [Arthrobacter sp. ISL-28]
MADRKMTRNAGEHWVCSVLAPVRLGGGAYPGRLERIDILAVQTGGPEWFALVMLDPDDRTKAPRTFIAVVSRTGRRSESGPAAGARLEEGTA